MSTPVFTVDPANGDWQSLAEARDGLRQLRTAGELRGPASVEFLPGTYEFREPVDFGPEDSETTYQAREPGTVHFDGGESLQGWREQHLDGKRVWTLDLPEVKAGLWRFRSLFVNGRRRPRARWPKFSPDAEGVRNVRRIAALRYPEKRKLFDGDHVFKPAEGDFQQWASLPDAEVVLLHYWIETRLGTPRYDAKTGWVECARRSVFNLYESFNPKLARYYIDNLQEALSDPGEWYLDRSQGLLTYLPMPEEELATTILIAPRIKFFISAGGESFGHDQRVPSIGTERFVHALHFVGIRFSHTDWFQPAAVPPRHNRIEVEDVALGSAAQAAVNVRGVIDFRWARNCSIRDCTLDHIGFLGLEFGPGCLQCAATGNRLQDLGAGGIKAGGAEVDGAVADRTGNLTLSDNTITDFGRVFHQSVGILLTHAFACDVVHNRISHGCYTGISCGWSWGYAETISRNNRIECNHIHDIGQGVLSDMGAIYMLGVQPGTLVRGNHIAHVSCADYGGWGIYPDEGCSHVLIEHNWIHDTQGSPLRLHFCRELAVRHNVFARSRQEGLVGIGKVEGHRAATLARNIFIGPSPALFEGGYAGDVRNAFECEANLLWFGGEPPPPCRHPDFRNDVPHQISWQMWQAAGHDCLSLIADPQITESADSLLFADDSPASKTGFVAWDWSRCGPRLRN